MNIEIDTENNILVSDNQLLIVRRIDTRLRKKICDE